MKTELPPKTTAKIIVFFLPKLSANGGKRIPAKLEPIISKLINLGIFKILKI